MENNPSLTFPHFFLLLASVIYHIAFPHSFPIVFHYPDSHSFHNISHSHYKSRLSFSNFPKNATEHEKALRKKISKIIENGELNITSRHIASLDSYDLDKITKLIYNQNTPPNNDNQASSSCGGAPSNQPPSSNSCNSTTTNQPHIHRSSSHHHRPIQQQNVNTSNLPPISIPNSFNVNEINVEHIKPWLQDLLYLLKSFPKLKYFLLVKANFEPIFYILNVCASLSTPSPYPYPYPVSAAAPSSSSANVYYPLNSPFSLPPPSSPSSSSLSSTPTSPILLLSLQFLLQVCIPFPSLPSPSLVVF